MLDELLDRAWMESSLLVAILSELARRRFSWMKEDRGTTRDDIVWIRWSNVDELMEDVETILDSEDIPVDVILPVLVCGGVDGNYTIEEFYVTRNPAGGILVFERIGGISISAADNGGVVVDEIDGWENGILPGELIPRGDFMVNCGMLPLSNGEVLQCYAIGAEADSDSLLEYSDLVSSVLINDSEREFAADDYLEEIAAKLEEEELTSQQEIEEGDAGDIADSDVDSAIRQFQERSRNYARTRPQ
jgi:hypothetical protein